MLHYIRALGWALLGGLVGSLLGATLVAAIAGIGLLASDSREGWAVLPAFLFGLVVLPLSFLCGFSFGMHIGVSRPSS
jgi:hypothetical protein